MFDMRKMQVIGQVNDKGDLIIGQKLQLLS